jgi:hypothetical protein
MVVGPDWTLKGERLCCQNQSYFTTGGLPPISPSWSQAPWDPRPVFYFKWTLAVIVLMFLASAVILGSESRGTHDHILRCQIPDSPILRARSPYLYPPTTGWTIYTLRHWVPFSLPPTTRKASMEVFEHAATRNSPDCAGEDQQQFFGLD